MCVAKRVALLLGAFFILGSVGRADVGAKLRGVIKDETGSVIAGAKVAVTNMASGAKQTVTTGEDGAYTFPVVAVGRYQMDVTVAGFEGYRRTGLVFCYINK